MFFGEICTFRSKLKLFTTLSLSFPPCRIHDCMEAFWQVDFKAINLSCLEIFTAYFVHKSNPPEPLISSQQHFRKFCRLRLQLIRNRRGLRTDHGVLNTAKSILKVSVKKKKVSDVLSTRSQIFEIENLYEIEPVVRKSVFDFFIRWF